MWIKFASWLWLLGLKKEKTVNKSYFYGDVAQKVENGTRAHSHTHAHSHKLASQMSQLSVFTEE